MIYASCLIKKNIVEQDEKEKGMRQLLNFGHTIGHAIETLEQFQIGHGEAVAIGMLVESYLSVQCGLLSGSVLVAIEDLLRDYGLPLQTMAFQDKIMFQERLMFDKKTKKKQAHFVLLQAIAEPYCQEGVYTHVVESSLLDQALSWAAVHFTRT